MIQDFVLRANQLTQRIKQSESTESRSSTNRDARARTSGPQFDWVEFSQVIREGRKPEPLWLERIKAVSSTETRSVSFVCRLIRLLCKLDIGDGQQAWINAVAQCWSDAIYRRAGVYGDVLLAAARVDLPHALREQALRTLDMPRRVVPVSLASAIRGWAGAAVVESGGGAVRLAALFSFWDRESAKYGAGWLPAAITRALSQSPASPGHRAGATLARLKIEHRYPVDPRNLENGSSSHSALRSGVPEERSRDLEVVWSSIEANLLSLSADHAVGRSRFKNLAGFFQDDDQRIRSRLKFARDYLRQLAYIELEIGHSALDDTSPELRRGLLQLAGIPTSSHGSVFLVLRFQSSLEVRIPIPIAGENKHRASVRGKTSDEFSLSHRWQVRLDAAIRAIESG